MLGEEALSAVSITFRPHWCSSGLMSDDPHRCDDQDLVFTYFYDVHAV